MSLEFARFFFSRAHRSIKHVRKYSGEPYEVHLEEVVRILIRNGEKDPEVLQAAFGHDDYEDVVPVKPEFGPIIVIPLFGYRVHDLITELTDVFTSEAYPDLNRETRKIREAQRISVISDAALRIKMCDLISNTSSICSNDPGFARVYLTEKRRILSLVRDRVDKSDDLVLAKSYGQANEQISGL